MNCPDCGKFMSLRDSFNEGKTGYGHSYCGFCDSEIYSKTTWSLEIWGEYEPTTVSVSKEHYLRHKENLITNLED